MTTLKIDKHYSIVCEWVKTRTAFKHTARLVKDYWQTIDETKVCYQNRTWESFEFESVINALLDKTNHLTKARRRNFMARISGKASEEIKEKFGAIAMVAKMGEIFNAGDQKATNDWKARMLKAGLGNSGLIMPDDWDELDENTKQVRLNGAIQSIS